MKNLLLRSLTLSSMLFVLYLILIAVVWVFVDIPFGMWVTAICLSVIIGSFLAIVLGE